MNLQNYLFIPLLAQFACGDGAGPQARDPQSTAGRQHWVSLSAGTYHSCGVTVEGAAYCWGLNPGGALGTGDPVTASVRPVQVLTEIRFRSISVGGAFSCGLSTAGRAYCWGTGLAGALGDGKNAGSPTPVAVADARDYSAITVGSQHACALTSEGEAYCWGDNASGKLGDGTTIQRSVPTRVATSELFRSISAGNLQTCAVSVEGRGYCWGKSGYGELGIACTVAPCGSWSTPQAISTDLKLVSVSAGNTFTCALTTSAEAWCWGAMDLPWYEGLSKLGVLGNGVLGGSAIPVKVAGTHRFTEVVAGVRSACAITTTSEAYCWGTNMNGELGTGNSDSDGHPNPTRVIGGSAFTHVAVGESTCALDESRVAYCWAMVVGQPDDKGQIRIEGLLTRPTLLPNPNP